MRAKAIISTLALLLGAVPGHAQMIEDVARMFGEVLATAEICEELKLNDALMVVFAFQRGYAPDDLRADGELGRRMEAEKTRLLLLLSGRNRDAICKTELLLYGPEGREIPGLIEAR